MNANTNTAINNNSYIGWGEAIVLEGLGDTIDAKMAAALEIGGYDYLFSEANFFDDLNYEGHYTIDGFTEYFFLEKMTDKFNNATDDADYDDISKEIQAREKMVFSLFTESSLEEEEIHSEIDSVKEYILELIWDGKSMSQGAWDA